MPVTQIVERRGSGDFDRGPTGANGQILFAVFGADSQDEALAAAEADSRAPLIINGYLRGKGKVTEIGDSLDFVDFDYERSIPNVTADASAGQSPTEARPSPPGGGDNNSPLSRDVTFSTGGGTRKATVSLETVYAASADGPQEAPDFGGLIGVDIKTGEIHGCEVLAPSCDFTVTKRFPSLTLGWFRFMMDCVATTNSEVFLNLDVGEVLFKGADGNYKDGEESAPDPHPWTVTGRFGYSRNLTLEDDPDDCTFGAVTVPDIKGWQHVWTIPKVLTKSVTLEGQPQEYKVSEPRFVYVERVYREADHNLLGFE